MTIEKKLLGTSPSGDGPNVEDVFSTYLYDGNGSALTITNGIDLSGEGGLVWIKDRANKGDLKQHYLYDTERGVGNYLSSSQSSSGSFAPTSLTAFNSNGFTFGSYPDVNGSGDKFASWTFRKAPRFFDVVTYTGNGVAGREIAHDLGVEPGMILIKRTDTSGSWRVYHRSLSNTVALALNSTDQALDYDPPMWDDTSATSTVFTVGSNSLVNSNPPAGGATYVAYLFAHDPDGVDNDGMIACGSWTGNGLILGGPDIDLGWEPQYILYKSTGVKNWIIADSMRGLPIGLNDEQLFADTSDDTQFADRIALSGSGFSIVSNNADCNTNGVEYIYMAIRAPMMVEPESGTEVFAIDTQDGTPLPEFKSTFPVDMRISKYTSAGAFETNTRLTDNRVLEISGTGSEGPQASAAFDFMNGWGTDTGTDSTFYSWMFKRAKGFFDVVAYTGNSTSGHTMNHSLGVVPEMIWVKRRNGATNWAIYNQDIGNTKVLNFAANGAGVGSFYWNNTTPTSTQFTLGSDTDTNNGDMVAYLFATLDGVSKCGNYTGNGSSQNIACGFSAGARFVLIKRTDAIGDWYMWDTERGIVSGNDPHLSLNSTAAQVTSDDSIDPQSAGFTVNQVAATDINVTSASYIFLAIA